MSATSRLQQVITHYRQLLMQHEATATQALEAAYAQVLAAIQPRLDALYREINAKLQAGEDIPLSWLYESNRLEVLRQFLSGQIDHFGALAMMTTAQLQHIGVTLGGQAAQALLQSTVPSGVNWNFGMPSPSAIANLVGATQAGSPLADLFNGFGREAAKNVSQALITGLSLGHNPRQIAPQVQQALQVPRWRALTISRTECIRSYRNANLETFRANHDVCSGWIWQSSLSSRTCVACIAMNGTFHSLDEEMGSHPACRCVMSPRTRDWSEILGPLEIDASNIPDTRPTIQSGSSWFDAQDEATQRKMLGNDKLYSLYSSGKLTLKDLVKVKHSDDWGKSIGVRPMRELVKR